MPNSTIDSIDVNGVTYDLEDASAVKSVTVNNITHMPLSGDVDLGDLQEELVSGSNIKTINNNSILGSGNLEVGGGGTVIYDGDSTADTPYDNLFMETVVSGVDAVNVGLDMDLLWENRSLSSGYSSGTISVDLTNYQFVYVRLLSLVSTTDRYFDFILVKNGGITICSGVGNYSANRNTSRYVNVTNSGVEFYPTYYTETYGSTASARSDMFVPYQIYGIRGHIYDLTGD